MKNIFALNSNRLTLATALAVTATAGLTDLGAHDGDHTHASPSGVAHWLSEHGGVVILGLIIAAGLITLAWRGRKQTRAATVRMTTKD